MICLKSFPDQNLPLQAIQSAMLAGGFGLEKAGESFQPKLSNSMLPCLEIVQTFHRAGSWKLGSGFSNSWSSP